MYLRIVHIYEVKLNSAVGVYYFTEQSDFKWDIYDVKKDVSG